MPARLPFTHMPFPLTTSICTASKRGQTFTHTRNTSSVPHPRARITSERNTIPVSNQPKMGVTLSHTAISPLSMTSTIIGLVSFAFTIATFVNVFWSSLQTIRAAPSEIRDYLSNLKQELLEERRHLRKVGRRMKSDRRGRSGSDPGGGKRRHSGGRAYFERDEQAERSRGERDNLRLLRTTVRDMIRTFRALEYPFLKPEFQNTDSAHWSTNTPTLSEKHPSYSHPSPHASSYPFPDDEELEAQGLGHSNRLGHEYRTCGFRERWLWLRRKQDIVGMSELLSRLEVRRVAHEVGRVMMMVGDIGRDIEDVRNGVGMLEGRLGRIVGVRRVE
jgi:hypothetical protein